MLQWGGRLADRSACKCTLLGKWTPAIACIFPLVPSDPHGPPLPPRKSRTRQSCWFLGFLIQNPYSKCCHLGRARLCCTNVLTLSVLVQQRFISAYSKCAMAHGSQDSSLVGNGSGTLLLYPVTPSFLSRGTGSWRVVCMLLNSSVSK